MLGIIMWLLVATAISVVTFYTLTRWDQELLGIFLGVVFIIWLGLGWFPSLGFFGGLLPEYGSGSRVGYLTKVSTRGIFYKTCEGSLQVGTGEMAALQAPWDFSIPRDKCEELAEWSEKLSKTRILINYEQWLFMPFKIGSSSYLVVSYKQAD